nr:AAA family ATPase [uncultured Schaedlerella sp.]
MIDPNNSGKTNFIKALSFCADMMNCSGSLIGDSAFQTMISKRGMGDLFNKYSDNPTKSIRMKWNIDLTGSKKVEGINMPQRLNPENVAAICTHYFSKNYMALKTFQV